MRGMVVERTGPIETDPLVRAELPIPEPAPNEILVRVMVCGVCRTDLHVAEGDLRPKHPRIIPGHEIVGVVERMGVSCKRFAPGDRVGIAWLRETCGICAYCRRGGENLLSQCSLHWMGSRWWLCRVGGGARGLRLSVAINARR